MYAIGDFLTDSDGTTGIKSLVVHYDSLFVNVIASDSGTFYSHLLIDKLIWDYDSEEYLNTKAPIIVNLGETSVENFACSQLIGTELLSKTKKVLIFILEKTDSSFVINIHEYDINLHTIKKIYPVENMELLDWENNTLGELSESQKPIMYVNRNIIDILISTASYINIFTFDQDKGLIGSRRYAQDLNIPLIIKTFTRNSDDSFLCFYENDNQMIPFRLPIISS